MTILTWALICVIVTGIIVFFMSACFVASKYDDEMDKIAGKPEKEHKDD